MTKLIYSVAKRMAPKSGCPVAILAITLLVVLINGIVSWMTGLLFVVSIVENIIVGAFVLLMTQFYDDEICYLVRKLK